MGRVAERGVRGVWSETVTFKDFALADEGRLCTSCPRFSWMGLVPEKKAGHA